MIEDHVNNKDYIYIIKNNIDKTLNVPLNDVIAFVLFKTESFDNVEEVDFFFIFF